jgi:hypothetical protein
MPEDQNSFQCSIIEIQMCKLSPKIQQESSCIFSQGIFFLWLQSSDLGTREVVTCLWLAFRNLCFKCFVSYATWHNLCLGFVVCLSKIPGPFDPRLQFCGQKSGKDFEHLGFQNPSLWFNPWSMHGPQPQKQAWQFLHFDCGSLEFAGVG